MQAEYLLKHEIIEYLEHTIKFVEFYPSTANLFQILTWETAEGFNSWKLISFQEVKLQQILWQSSMPRLWQWQDLILFFIFFRFTQQRCTNENAYVQPFFSTNLKMTMIMKTRSVSFLTFVITPLYQFSITL